MILAWATACARCRARAGPAGRRRRCTRLAADEARVFLALDRVAHATDPGAGAGLCLCGHLVTPRSTGRDRRTGLGLGGGGHLAGRLLDGLYDIQVAGTAAQVAADPLADLRLARGGFSPSSQAACMIMPGCRTRTGGRAVPEGLLQRLSAPPVGHPLDRLDLAAVGLDGEDQQDLTVSPSSWTVQAPQLPVSQPTLVPVSPSRRAGVTRGGAARPPPRGVPR